jgi:hypothetical protein
LCASSPGPERAVWASQDQHLFTRADNPAIFWILAAGAGFGAVIFALLTYDLHFRLKLSRPVIQGPAILMWLPLILPGIAVVAFLIAWAFYLWQR